MNLDWRGLSYGYLFAMLETGRWIDGVAPCLHPESALPYDFIQKHSQQFRALPTVHHLKERFNLDWQYHWLKGFTIEEISQRIKLEKTKFDVQRTVTELQKLLTTDAQVDIQAYLKPLTVLQEGLYKSTDSKVFRLSQWGETAKYFLSGQDTVRICDYGFEHFDAITGGISLNQLIILYANTTQGKSTLARAIAANIAMQGKRALYFTMEESAKKSVIKALSTLVRVNASSIIENTLSASAYQKLCEFGHIPGDVIFVDKLESKSMAEVHKYVHQYQPDILVIDQIPLFTPNGSMKVDDVTQVSRNLKDFCQQTGLPIIALTQANRVGATAKKPTMEETMGFAYAMCQDGDVVIFLWPDEQGPGYTRKRCTFLKVRDREKGQYVDLRWDLGNGIIEEESVYLSQFAHSPINGGFNVQHNQPTQNVIVPQFQNSTFAQSI